MTIPKPQEPYYWRDVPHSENQELPTFDESIDMDDEDEDEEDTETELEADFDDANILDALASLARELDEAILEVDDEAEEDKPAAIVP